MGIDSLEALINAIVGFLVSAGATYYLLPAWGLQPTASQSIGITAMFFVFSFARSFVLRRIFRGVGDAD